MEACCLVHRRGFRILFRRKHLLLVQSETDYAGRVADEGREDAHVAVVASMWRRRFHGDAQPSVIGDRAIEFLGKSAVSVPLEPIGVIEPSAEALDGLADALALGPCCGAQGVNAR